MSAPVVRRLGGLRKADAAEVGGKAAQLGELIAAGARVPDGLDGGRVETLPVAQLPALIDELADLAGPSAYSARHERAGMA